MSHSQQRGCVGKDPNNPKKQCATPEQADDHLEYIVTRYGTSPSVLNVFQCRYAPKGSPHWHVGHSPSLTRRRDIGRHQRNPPGRRGRRR